MYYLIKEALEIGFSSLLSEQGIIAISKWHRCWCIGNHTQTSALQNSYFVILSRNLMFVCLFIVRLFVVLV